MIISDQDIAEANRAILRAAIWRGCEYGALSTHSPSFPETLAMFNQGSIWTWDGGSEQTIWGSLPINAVLRRWHDWHHWSQLAPFTAQGEATAFASQIRDLYALGLAAPRTIALLHGAGTVPQRSGRFRAVLPDLT